MSGDILKMLFFVTSESSVLSNSIVKLGPIILYYRKFTQTNNLVSRFQDFSRFQDLEIK
jgi:hypothetical protein